MDKFVIHRLLLNKTMDQPIYRSAEQRLNKWKEEYEETDILPGDRYNWKEMIKLQEDFDFNSPGLFGKCVSMNENFLDVATE